MSEWRGHCHRCGEASRIHTMSRFSTALICMPCETKERAHPEYKRAADAELAAVRAGNYNFPGTGKPKDL